MLISSIRESLRASEGMFHVKHCRFVAQWGATRCRVSDSVDECDISRPLPNYTRGVSVAPSPHSRPIGSYTLAVALLVNCSPEDTGDLSGHALSEHKNLGFR